MVSGSLCIIDYTEVWGSMGGDYTEETYLIRILIYFYNIRGIISFLSRIQLELCEKMYGFMGLYYMDVGYSTRRCINSFNTGNLLKHMAYTKLKSIKDVLEKRIYWVDII
jgi:negative regulator of genetic competence, sporulation and motility